MTHSRKWLHERMILNTVLNTLEDTLEAIENGEALAGTATENLAAAVAELSELLRTKGMMNQ